jgi:peroxiredoxin Q/BCP
MSIVELKIGDNAPEFNAINETGEQITLGQFRGKKVILYFYPKDDTPGCTTEACDFRDNLNNISSHNCVVLGVSKDNSKSHQKFITKHSLNFPLLVDADGQICMQYGVWVQKSMMGKKYMGIERSTFLIDEKGFIQQIWRGVKVQGHVQDVISTLKT